MAVVKVYFNPARPWCQRAKRFLEKNGIEFQDLNVAAIRKPATKND